MSASAGPSSASKSRRPSSPVKLQKPSGIVSPSKALSPRLSSPSPVKRPGFGSSTVKPCLSPRPSSSTPAPPKTLATKKANKVAECKPSLVPPPPGPTSIHTSSPQRNIDTNIPPPQGGIKKPTITPPHYLQTTRASIVHSTQPKEGKASGLKKPSPSKLSSAPASSSPRPIDATVLTLQATLSEHISQQTCDLQAQLDGANTECSALTIKLDNALLAVQELEDQMTQKDVAIADLTKACARYKSDCESFAAKALEWKQKHDDAMAGHAAQGRRVAAAKTRALEKRMTYVAEEMANSGDRAGMTMDYSIYVVPEGDEDEANVERCESILSNLQKELKKFQDQLKGESLLQDEVVHWKASAVAAQRQVDDMTSKLNEVSKSHSEVSVDAGETAALLEETVADLAAQTHAFDRQCMVGEDTTEKLRCLVLVVDKLRFDKQLLAERYGALQTAQLESQQRLDELDETKARMKEKTVSLKAKLAEATSDQRRRNSEDLGNLDLSIAHAALQTECIRLQKTTEEQHWFTSSQALAIDVLRGQLDHALNAFHILDTEQKQPVTCPSPTRQFGSLQFALYETAIQAYMDEIKVLRDEKRVAAESDDEEKQGATKMTAEFVEWTRERQTLLEQVETLTQQGVDTRAQVKAHVALVVDLEGQLTSQRQEFEAVQRALEVETLKSETTKAQLVTTTSLTHELAAQVKQFPGREEKFRSVISQLQAQETANESKVAELESTVDTLTQTVLVLQGEAEASLGEISALLAQQKSMHAALAQRNVEATTLQDQVQSLQTGTTRLQTIMEQDKEDLIDGYVEEVKHLQKRVLGLTKRCEDSSSLLESMQSERDAALTKLRAMEATTKTTNAENQGDKSALQVQLDALERAVEAKTKEVGQWQQKAAELDGIVAQLQAEKAQYKTEVHAIEAILHENSPLQLTVDALQNTAKTSKSPKSPSKHGKNHIPSNGSPHAKEELKKLRQRVKELELEKELLVAEVEQAKLSKAKDSNVAFYVAQVDGLEEKLSEQTAMYLASVKQAQVEYKDLEAQYQAKIRHLEMELHLDEARIEALEGRLAETLSSRSVTQSSPMRRGSGRR
ncbi:hypothetical protein H257_10521 [Aphanomyces astaci]|uniref:Uncharacterized protein n=1 Tax=Aphanomyces astaci TaxID=112090 RepID=W4G5C7_APHAT|nr:hypothetical protein H257_10521 [Aphanomyces astaci]ETV74890.1 hypothetical protein H257_10521 [Aphanomyces astaci]|eukprot:XP_009835394.1 hypothetical protein H257_10521 [Aphanomyces astaci]